MQIAVNRTIRKLRQVSIDACIAGLSLLILISMIAYFGFMTLQLSRTNALLELKGVELLTRRNELKKVEENPGYTKFLAAKYLESETKTVDREQSLKYLTSLLEELKAYNKQQRSVNLANFQINEKNITLEGTVSALKDIYAEGGIIDRFSGYPFIEFFRVPYYRQNIEDGGYNFLLNADIYHYDGTEQTH